MRALLRLAGGGRSRRRLDAVIGAVAHQMGERILDQLQHLAVELGLGAVHLELDLLAEIGRQIAHDARQLLPGVADRLHARLHHAFLQLGGDIRQPLQRHLEVGIFVPADDFQELIAREHQLRNRVHETIERLDIDADGLVGELWSPASAHGLEALGRRMRRLLRQLLCGWPLRRRSLPAAADMASVRGACRRHPLRGRDGD